MADTGPSEPKRQDADYEMQEAEAEDNAEVDIEEKDVEEHAEEEANEEDSVKGA